MAQLGNAWHIPNSPEPRGRAGMLDPVGAIVPGTAITIFSGNQFQGGGNPGNQLQTGSNLFFKRQPDPTWISVPLLFFSVIGNNKYYAGNIPAQTLQPGDNVEYYLCIAYDDHVTTFLHAQGNVSTQTQDEAVAQATPFTFTVKSSALMGQWGPVFSLPNVAIHTHVLPNGKILSWGRRDRSDQTLNEHECTPYLWDPITGVVTNTPPPTLADGTRVNLFCAGHAFLPDGRLLVVGGHWLDQEGLNQATIYDSATGTWTPTALMSDGRWYPTARTLPDGSVLVLSGSYREPTQPADNQILVNDDLQVWQNGTWTSIVNFVGLALYPRMHISSDGRIFMSGNLAQSYLLDTSNGGSWIPLTNPGGTRINGLRDYAPALMYDKDKVIYIGGGNDDGTHQPSSAVETIDLGSATPSWRATQPMNFRRRQHNATVLPDGTVLVTGGTGGGGGPNNGFNDLGPGQPVHIAELWNPNTEQWAELAAEEEDRCYHATAVLLPDATVLSAGGGEYFPDNINANDPEDTHRNAQIFSPPYLFKGVRPAITAAPSSINYNETFVVNTAQPDNIEKVSLLRLPSVTHSIDQNQHINFLNFQVIGGELKITTPASANLCPPGHYMLFILNEAGVPSIAHIINLQAELAPVPVAVAPQANLAEIRMLRSVPIALNIAKPLPGVRRKSFRSELARAKTAEGTQVVVGITGTCPYGIAACWGGAYEALSHLEAVELVAPIPNGVDSTATVFLNDKRLPNLIEWQKQFYSIVNGTYQMRGVEVTLKSGIEVREGKLFLKRSDKKPPVQLAPLEAIDVIQWNQTAQTLMPLKEGEALAFERLADAIRGLAVKQTVSISVTGPLKQSGRSYQMRVRLFEMLKEN